MITKSMFNKHIDAGNERRGVAPIIATLLMVAIAVVGGILIFVFAQGFFNQTDIAPPAAEALTIFGYDARDSADLRSHASATNDITAAGGTANGKLGDSDGLAIYVRNTGSTAVTISKVTVLGQDYTFDTGTAITAAVPADGKFVLLRSGTTATGQQSIAAGEEMTLLVAYEGAASGDVRTGKAIKVMLTTGGGQVFSQQVVAGVQTGA